MSTVTDIIDVADVAAPPATAAPETAPRSGRRVWARLLLLLACVPGVVAIAIAIAGPWVAPHDVGDTVAVPYSQAGGDLLLGADQLGHDVWSEVLHGGRRLLVVPLVATVVTSIVGGLLGIVSGYLGGWTDRLASRVVDVLFVLPSILVLLVLVNGWGASGTVLVAAVLLTNGPHAMRYARSASRRIVNAGFVEQAVALGERRSSVVVREIVPNVAGPLVAEASLRLISAIYLIATASFLGYGEPRPATNWARMVQENLQGAGLNAWAVIAPAVAIVSLTTFVMIAADAASRRWAR